MKITIIVLFVLALPAMPVVAALTCGDDLKIKKSELDVNCTACNQWATGKVLKPSSESGWLCLLTCTTHSYAICDYNIVLWVGTSYGTNCLDTATGTVEINWTFQSKRTDWSSTSYAEIYIYTPCNGNCTVKNVKPEWDDLCYSCSACD